MRGHPPDPAGKTMDMLRMTARIAKLRPLTAVAASHLTGAPTRRRAAPSRAHNCRPAANVQRQIGQRPDRAGVRLGALGTVVAIRDRAAAVASARVLR